MKISLSIILVFLSYNCFAQSAICNEADPFCAGDSSLVFPNTTGNSGFGSVGCLVSTPNPTWFFLQIDQPGNLNFEIIQSTGGFDQNGNAQGFLIDVDFALWGPYDNLDVCQGNTPPPSEIIDCSFLPDSIENASITNAQSGEYYIMVITNFDGSSGSILLNQVSGEGSTDCSIVNRIEACEGEVLTLDATTATATNYVWEYNDGSSSVEVANGDFPSIDVTESGNYLATPQNSNNTNLQTQEFNVAFRPYITINDPEPLVACEQEVGSGTTVFDLQNANTSIYNQSNTVSFSYYSTENAALNANQNDQLNANFTNTQPYNQSVFVRVEAPNLCADVVELQLQVSPLPEVSTIDERKIYCIENFPNPIILNPLSDGIDSSLYEYLWSTSETSSTIEINTAGTYTVEIINPETNCSLTKTFEVTESSLANFNLEVEDSSREKAIEVILEPSSLGAYEFAIDEPYNFQESKRFEDLEPGIYTIYARDIQGCGISEQTVGVLGIMDFFTPNGDGINDYWKVTGILNNSQENIQLQVYDRYGKLLSSFTNTSQGWDGTYNGKPMPVDDYWYRVIFTDGRVQTGSFTLKR